MNKRYSSKLPGYTLKIRKAIIKTQLHTKHYRIMSKYIFAKATLLLLWNTLLFVPASVQAQKLIDKVGPNREKLNAAAEKLKR